MDKKTEVTMKRLDYQGGVQEVEVEATVREGYAGLRNGTSTVRGLLLETWLGRIKMRVRNSRGFITTGVIEVNREAFIKAALVLLTETYPEFWNILELARYGLSYSYEDMERELSLDDGELEDARLLVRKLLEMDEADSSGEFTQFIFEEQE